MLSNHLTIGTKILGLSALINSGRPGFDGCYRIVSIGSTKALEFFDRAPGSGECAVKILPYRPGKVASQPIAGGDVISGEFTGCVMATYNDGQALFAAHVDTNKDTSQRDAWNTQKGGSGMQVVSEVDTTGKLQQEHGNGAVILCVSDSAGAVTYHHVSKQRHEYSFSKQKDSPFTDRKFDTLYTVIPSGGY
jgi:hypothetical protein